MSELQELNDQVVECNLQREAHVGTLQTVAEELSNCIELFEDAEGITDDSWFAIEGLVKDAHSRIVEHLDQHDEIY